MNSSRLQTLQHSVIDIELQRIVNGTRNSSLGLVVNHLQDMQARPMPVVIFEPVKYKSNMKTTESNTDRGGIALKRIKHERKANSTVVIKNEAFGLAVKHMSYSCLVVTWLIVQQVLAVGHAGSVTVLLQTKEVFATRRFGTETFALLC